MNWHDAALGLAGVIGIGVAVVHGVLVQRLMIRPIEALAEPPFSQHIQLVHRWLGIDCCGSLVRVGCEARHRRARR
jgi:hypothetical protein